ncbi:MAG: hypothetical protein K2O18_18375 [Oscillospiraceae bacterium]|nr:hypothetical protein [Oscillospiraceae bacterium]
MYTEVVKKKLDTILNAFEDYIDGQDYFDIVYSKKIGYVMILVQNPGEAGAEALDTPEKMLDVLFNEIINDVIVSPENTTHIPDSNTLTEYEKTESRRRISAILETIEDGRDDYLNFLDSYLKEYQEQC